MKYLYNYVRARVACSYQLFPCINCKFYFKSSEQETENRQTRKYFTETRARNRLGTVPSLRGWEPDKHKSTDMTSLVCLCNKESSFNRFCELRFTDAIDRFARKLTRIRNSAKS